jgi:hypothetical protein
LIEQPIPRCFDVKELSGGLQTMMISDAAKKEPRDITRRKPNAFDESAIGTTICAAAS